MSSWNEPIIEEFRNNAGIVRGIFDGKPLLLLHTTGARSGKQRINPLMYQPLDHGYAVFASKNGAPTNPDWYYNAVANPEVEVEVGSARLRMTARVADPDERDPIWARQKLEFPQFANYEAGTEREIPVIVLEPR